MNEPRLEPHVQPLSRRHRTLIFVLSLLLFATVVPMLVLYAIGYRVDVFSGVGNIRTVGGMYISADAEEISIFVDDEPVEDMRIFQNAAYIQNLDAGLHQVHVQGDDINTWVKTLPVYAHFVTEASSFNLPVRPQVRLVTEYENELGQSVILPRATSTFAFASTTNTFLATSTLATSTLVVNPEFIYLDTLFASSTQERLQRAQFNEMNAERFQFFNPGVPTSSDAIGTTTVESNDIMLRELGGEVYAHWLGALDRTPYHFCVTYAGPQATSLAYGQHVYDDLVDEFASSTDLLSKRVIGEQFCRQSIKIDRKRQAVQYFDFVPGSDHVVLMQLQDGVYVVEIDDRAWQNVQLLYPGDFLEVLVDSGSIFVKDGEYILEVFTELQS